MFKLGGRKLYSCEHFKVVQAENTSHGIPAVIDKTIENVIMSTAPRDLFSDIKCHLCHAVTVCSLFMLYIFGILY